MPFLDVGNLTSSDVLRKNKLWPWWEKYRGHCLSAWIFSSLFMVYLTTIPGSNVNCLPSEEKEVSSEKFSTSHAAAVNNYCFHNYLPWQIIFVGPINFAFSIVVLIASSWWTSHPAVINMFSVIAKISEIISDLNMDLPVLKDAIVKPIGEDTKKDYRKFRKAATLIWKKSPGNIEKIYFWRCVILLVTLMASIAMSLYLLRQQLRSTDEFSCEISERNQFAHVWNGTFKCVRGNNEPILRPLSFFFAVSQFAQIVFAYIGIIKSTGYKGTVTYSRISERNAKFSIKFWKSGNPDDSGLLKNLMKFTFSEEAVAMMRENTRKAIVEGDIEFLEQVQTLADKDDMGIIIHDLASSPRTEHVQWEKNFLRIAESTKLPLNGRYETTQALAKTKRWKLLVAALDFRDTTEHQNDKDKFGIRNLKENLNLDEITSPPYFSPWDEEAGSLLYYAMDREFYSKNHEFRAVQRFLEIMNDGRRKYVHFRGKSMTLKHFIEKHKLKALKKKIHELLNSEGREESASQAEIKKLFKEVKGLGRNPTERYLNSLMKRVYRYKFSSWDGNAIKFAVYCFRHSLWKVFVTLLNAYIVTEEERREQKIGKLPCGVITFNPEHIGNIFPICLKTQPLGYPQGYFVPTAARHILACCAPFERKLCLNYIHDPQYNLSEEDKDSLLLFIKTCPKPSLNSYPSAHASGSVSTSLQTRSGIVPRRPRSAPPNVGIDSWNRSEEIRENSQTTGEALAASQVTIDIPDIGVMQDEEEIPLKSRDDEEIQLTSGAVAYSRKPKKDRRSRL